MSNKVTVVETANNQVINVNANNPEFGYVRVGQTIPTFNEEGWLSTENRYFLLKGKINELQASGLSAGMELTGKLVRQESLEPFNDYSQPKVAGSSGVICKVEGQPIYSRIVYDRSGTMQDTLIAHDNKEEIIAGMTPTNVIPLTQPASFSDAFDTQEEVSNETEEVVEDMVESKVDNSLNEEVEIEETIDEVVDELDLETDFEL